MNKILAIAGSNSTTSINQRLVEWVAGELPGQKVKVLKIGSYQIPIYSEDLERTSGIPGQIMGIAKEIEEATALILSVSEHNGTWSAFFKNIIDWLSRYNRNFLEHKKILLMSTSPGQRGGLTAVEHARQILPRFSGEVVESFSFPSFYQNFNKEMGTVTNEVLLLGLREVLTTFSQNLMES
ncbi:NAD(P)H-dependent oxidoreductase [Aquimarina sp. ERC-38]|uniref:NADPH-dependent FMN reductase n=1 Tax=Aquimarina sp. ERC-38 TaxID=2949996 RepID=UPI002246F4A0|nr:NAD(P)H-dependent oxidoreductase [Aquimarina sp. ERC-38]UZO80016.1 NAD(P)H-dependent oxidoreductase [Aquimarina sp. ERC-38]